MANRPPSAFPLHGFTADASGALNGEYMKDPGMTLRDYIAIQIFSNGYLEAVKAIMLNEKANGRTISATEITERIMRTAYAAADVAMVVRELPPQQ